MITRRRTLQLLGAGSVAVLAAPRIGGAAGLDEVQVATPAAISDAPIFIAEHKGYWAEQKIAMKLINMQTGPQMIAPLGAGQLDVAAAATSAGLFNAAARGIGIKIVADKGSNQPGYAYVSLLVRKELVDSGTFKTMKDLKGLKVAEPGKGGSTGSTVNQALKSAGLAYDDIEHVIVGFPEMLTGMQNGAIDAAIVPEPFNTFGRNKGIGVRFASDAFYPHQTIAVVLYGNDFIAKRKEVAVRFIVAYLKAVRFYNGAIKDGHFAGANAPEVIDILTKETRYKDPALYKDVVPNGCDPDGKVDLASIDTDLAFWREQKYVEGNPKAADVVDHSYVEAALKVLGPYHA
jgi:NitT/TauT family transport system substrate-binding protein